jgi:hypothetical protein
MNAIEQLRRADPAAGMDDWPLDERARADLRQLLAEESVAAKAFPRRRLVVGAVLTGAAAMLVVGGVQLGNPLGGSQVAEAATPPLLPGELDEGRPARESLLALAERAERDTTVPGDGDRHRVRTRGWGLWTDADDEDRVTSRVVEVVSELEWNADRSGRLVSTADGTTDVMTWGPGEYEPAYPGLPFPSEPDALLERLEPGHHISEYGTPGLLSAIVDLYGESMPSPAVRGGLLRLLAERGDLVALGSMTDRQGRRTEAFALDSDHGGLPNRLILMFESATGRLLANEEVLTERAGLLNVRIPSVIDYRLYL